MQAAVLLVQNTFWVDFILMGTPFSITIQNDELVSRKAEGSAK